MPKILSSMEEALQKKDNEVCYNTRKSRLYNRTRRGLVSHVRKGVYVPSYLIDKFMIACNAVKDGCLVYHSALEYYALHTQSFNWLYVHSATPFRTFTHLNETYIYKPVNYLINQHLDYTNESYPIKVTSLSQTIIDCIRHIDFAGGLEELLNALDWIGAGKLDESEMIQCLDVVPSKSAYQRTGYLLSLYQEQLGLSDAFFEHCRNQIGNNVSYLTPDEDCDAYDKYWKICVPKAIKHQNKYELH